MFMISLESVHDMPVKRLLQLQQLVAKQRNS